MSDKVVKTLPAKGGLPELTYTVEFASYADECVFGYSKSIMTGSMQEWKNYLIYRCPYCHSIHKTLLKIDENYNLREKLPLRCPKCGSKIRGKQFFYLENRRGSLAPSRIVLIKSNKGVTIKATYSNLVSYTNKNTKKWAWKPETYRTEAITFRIDGSTTVTRCFYDSSRGVKGRQFDNITYRAARRYTIDFFYSIQEYFLTPEKYEIFTMVLEKLMSEMTNSSFAGVPQKHYAYANSIKAMDPTFYLSMDSFAEHFNGGITENFRMSRNLFRHLKKGNYGYIARIGKSAGKSTRKLFVKDPLLTIPYRLLVKAGFENKDRLRTILTEAAKGNLFKLTYQDIYEIRDFVTGIARKDFEQFLVELLINEKIRCEKEAAERNDSLGFFDAYGGNLFGDVVGLMRTLNKKAENVKEIIDRSKITTDPQKLHDYLSEISQVVRYEKYEDYTFTYTEEALNLVEAPEFILPKDRGQLVVMARKYSNCVASYAHSIKYGNSVIVSKKIGDEYDVCIELNPSTNGYKLAQAKAFGNNLMNKRQYDEVVAWCKRHHIKYKACTDIKLLTDKDGKFVETLAGTYAYGAMGPQNNVPQPVNFNNDALFLYDDNLPF